MNKNLILIFGIFIAVIFTSLSCISAFPQDALTGNLSAVQVTITKSPIGGCQGVGANIPEGSFALKETFDPLGGRFFRYNDTSKEISFSMHDLYVNIWGSLNSAQGPVSFFVQDEDIYRIEVNLCDTPSSNNNDAAGLISRELLSNTRVKLVWALNTAFNGNAVCGGDYGEKRAGIIETVLNFSPEVNIKNLCGKVSDEICNNGRDDDGDGKVDCEDEDCADKECSKEGETCKICVETSNDGCKENIAPNLLDVTSSTANSQFSKGIVYNGVAENLVFDANDVHGTLTQIAKTNLKTSMSANFILPLSDAYVLLEKSPGLERIWTPARTSGGIELPATLISLFKVEDDGTIKEGVETCQGENLKEASITEIMTICPTEINMVGGYDIAVKTKKAIWKTKTVLGVPVPIPVFKEDSLIMQQVYKNIKINVQFAGGKTKGTLTLNMVTKLKDTAEDDWEDDIKQGVDASRSRVIKELQAKLEKKVTGPLDTELAKWGCRDGMWGNFEFDDGVTLVVCKRYETLTVESTMTYDFETGKVIVWGGSGSKMQNITTKIPRDKLPAFLDLIKDKRPLISDGLSEKKEDATPADAKFYVGWKGSGDWAWEGGAPTVRNPEEMIPKVLKTLSACSPETKEFAAEKDKEKNTIKAKGKHSYYYIQEPVNETREAEAVKILFNSEAPTTKVFHYDESKFTNEDDINLYKYEDNEIEDNCYVDILSQENFSVADEGGTFNSSLGVNIIVPEGFGDNTLTIQKVDLTDCIKKADTNQDRKIDLSEIMTLVDSYFNGDENIEKQDVGDMLFRWRF